MKKDEEKTIDENQLEKAESVEEKMDAIEEKLESVDKDHIDEIEERITPLIEKLEEKTNEILEQTRESEPAEEDPKTFDDVYNILVEIDEKIDYIVRGL